MMPSRLIQIEGKHHFLTERYDRINGEKIHTQTLAAMNPDATSYEDLFEVCRKLSIPASEQSELYRRWYSMSWAATWMTISRISLS